MLGIEPRSSINKTDISHILDLDPWDLVIEKGKERWKGYDSSFDSVENRSRCYASKAALKILAEANSVFERSKGRKKFVVFLVVVVVLTATAAVACCVANCIGTVVHAHHQKGE